MLSNTTEYISHFAHFLFMAFTIFLFMAEAWAETPDTNDDVHLGNDMDLSPRSHCPSSPVPDAIANNGALFPVSDDNAADPSHGLGRLPVPVGHHDHDGPPAVISKLSDMSVQSAACFVNNLRDRYVVAPGNKRKGSSQMICVQA